MPLNCPSSELAACTGKNPAFAVHKTQSHNPFKPHQVYGEFDSLGVSIAYYEFETLATSDWRPCFQKDSLELCLNLAGKGSVKGENATLPFEPMTAGFFLTSKANLQASRFANPTNRFISIAFSKAFLRELLVPCDGALNPIIERFVTGNSNHAQVSRQFRLSAEQERVATQLSRPHVPQAARALWYHGKILQLMAEFFFDRPGEDELLCDRQKRVARERVDRVFALLSQRLAEPPSLEEIGRNVGCSQFHLSRTFSQETGMTIPQCLRKLRMERAAELLREGRCNVTEAALQVGYSSLSHFTVAFRETFGCCPGLYPLKTSNSQVKRTNTASGR